MKIKTTAKELSRFKKSKVLRDPVPTAVTSGLIRSSQFEATTENMRLLEQCRLDWQALSDFRYRRRRSRKYYHGDQWHEIIKDPNTGRLVREEDYIKSQGKIPFKQNIISQIGKNIVGQYRQNPMQPIIYSVDKKKSAQADIMGITLEAALNLNNAKELDAQNILEFLISGSCFSKTAFSYWPNRDKEDLFIENKNPNRMFFNSDIRDIRLIDLYRIGEIIDTTIDRVIMNFARTKEQEKAIRQIYTGSKDAYHRANKTGSSDEMDKLSFFYPDNMDKCRLYEVWYQESSWRLAVHDTLDGTHQVVDMHPSQIDALNQERITLAAEAGIPPEEVALMNYQKHYEPVWKVKFLSPWGHCFYEGETPYEHQEHPYTVKLSPMIDGEIKGLVEDIIDQQRYINRLISLLDFIMGASAKGVLLVPESAIPDDMDISDYTDEWSKYNGVIKYKVDPKNPNALPQQIVANSTNIGAHEMLNLQLKLIMDISGVSSAIQGHEAKSGTPSSLYAQQAQNSMINSRDLFDKFIDYRSQRDKKAMSVIRQYYKEARIVNVGGKLSNAENQVYTPDIADIEMELKIEQGVDTPTYRALIDDMLMKLLEGQMIDIKMFLEHSSLPFADKLLQSIQSQEQQGVPPEMQQMLAAQAQSKPGGQQPPNPKSAAIMNQLQAIQ